MPNISLSNYFRWVFRHWLMSAVFVFVGAAGSVFYTLSLSPLYQAQVFFVFGEEGYSQGLLRRVDDTVMGANSASYSRPVTRRPEIRLAYLISSESFSYSIVDMLKHEFHDDLEKYREELSEYGTTFDEALFYFVRQNLYYYRHEMDEFHKLRWHFFDQELSRKQLIEIVGLYNELMIADSINELAERVELTENFEREFGSSRIATEVSDQVLIFKSRIELLKSGIKIIRPTSAFTVTNNEVYPVKSAVAVICFFAWMVIGISLLSFRLTHKLRIRVS